MKPIAAIIIMLAAVGTACTGAAPEQGHVAVVDTVGDTITVRTVSGSVWRDTMHLVPEVSIGVFEGPDPYMIGEPAALTVDEAGRVYMIDQQVPVVRVYAPDGTHLRDLGREGGGPGEYKRPEGIAVLPDGRIVIRDPGNGRMAVFASDGTYLEQWPHPSPTFSTSARLHVDASGNVYTSVLKEVGKPPWEWEYLLAKLSPDGEIVDSLEAPVWEYERQRLTAQKENSSSSRTVPFTPTQSWSFSPEGYFFGGVSTDYRIELFKPDGTVFRLERDWTAVPVQPGERQERERSITNGLRRQYPGWNWNGPPVPDSKPPFQDVFAGADGKVWVVLHQPGVVTMTEAEAREEERRTGRVPLRYREPLAFDVFQADGTYLGLVRAPFEMRASPTPVARGDLVWAVVRDDLDVASIVRFRIASPTNNETDQ